MNAIRATIAMLVLTISQAGYGQSDDPPPRLQPDMSGVKMPLDSELIRELFHLPGSSDLHYLDVLTARCAAAKALHVHVTVQIDKEPALTGFLTAFHSGGVALSFTQSGGGSIVHLEATSGRAAFVDPDRHNLTRPSRDTLISRFTMLGLAVPYFTHSELGVDAEQVTPDGLDEVACDEASNTAYRCFRYTVTLGTNEYTVELRVDPDTLLPLSRTTLLPDNRKLTEAYQWTIVEK